MIQREQLSLDEFVTAPKKTAMQGREPAASIASGHEAALGQEARKALRRVKRERVKTECFYVNVSLDRHTKRRLKLASFDAETSMQAIIEAAIVKYLDEIGA
jgi:hypothetical protein